MTGRRIEAALSNASSQGRCVMRGSCGVKAPRYDAALPCPYDGEPQQLGQEARDLLVSVCCPTWAQTPVCCEDDQIETLNSNMRRVEALLSNCPACRNNFHDFFCTMTCSPHQADFLNITATQTTDDGEKAVKTLEYYTSERYATGFYDSCKGVQQFGERVMNLIAPKAKSGEDWVRALGEYKADGQGSPFQIDFPPQVPSGKTQLDAIARNCADTDLANRCTCVDCPDVCTALPPVAPPGSQPGCHVGAMSCLTFVLTLGYSLIIAAFFVGFLTTRTLRRRREKRFNDTSSDDTALETPLSPRIHTLIGASSLAGRDGEDSLGTPSEARGLGRGASLLDPIETVQPRQYKLNNVLRRFFYRLGLSTASKPFLTFTIMFTVIGLLNLGWSRFEIETDPVRLWVSPDSESKLQSDYFNENFGPFYRVEQLFVTATDPNKPVLSWDHLNYLAEIESHIRQLSSPTGVTLDDVCFKPLGEDGPCVVQSPVAWFSEGLSEYNETTWAGKLTRCASHPAECLPEFLQPLEPKFVLGGIPSDVDKAEEDYLGSRAMVLTAVVSNSLDKAKLDRIEGWERVLREYLEILVQRAPKEAGLHFAFSTGVSLTEEINKSTNMDVRIVVLSYLAMFFYVAFTLGNGGSSSNQGTVLGSLKRWMLGLPRLFQHRSVSSSSYVDDTPTWLPRLPHNTFVHSKVVLGLFSIGLVVLSVSTSVGFFSVMGVKVTLIIAEVIPFLVLAVGVDNIFILVHEVDRQNLLHGPNANPTAVISSGAASVPDTRDVTFDGAGDDLAPDNAPAPTLLPVEERVARALARMGPSILLSTVTEVLAFVLGAMVPMPAVRNFAMYAAGSVFLNALLQVTVFVSALTLDLRRVEAGRMDIFPCIRLSNPIRLPDMPTAGAGLGGMAKFIRRYYAPFLLRPAVKSCVLAFFGGLFVASVIAIQHIDLGLDQRLALPSDSYLVDYFNHMDTYYGVGPPVFFVTQDVDAAKRSNQQHLCGRFTTCDELSLTNVLEAERQRTESSFIAEPTAPWVDDFFNWLNPALDECCRVLKRDPSKFCGPNERASRCQACFEDRDPAWNITMHGFPEGPEFMHYLKQWMASPTTQECPFAGAAQYGSAISFTPDGNGVQASHFRTWNAPLKSQADFINAFNAAHRIADDISRETGAKVFPYSIFHVYFDQYSHIAAIAQELLGLGLAAVLLVTAVLLGSWRTATIVTGVVALTVTTCMGVMAIWGVSLNALSVVNLVISLGIAVEFCAHLARAFMNAGTGLPVDHPAGQKERDERMYTALVDVGPSVLSGITFTKLIGITVLALTRSKLLETYYFRMWLTLIISGAIHGLVLLPVVLSIAGGPGFPHQEADEEWMSNAIRDDYEYAPFLADDDSIHSN